MVFLLLLFSLIVYFTKITVSTCPQNCVCSSKSVICTCNDFLWDSKPQSNVLNLHNFGFNLEYIDLFVVHSCDQLIITNDTFANVEIFEQFKLLSIKNIKIESNAFHGIRKSPKQIIIQDSHFDEIPEFAFTGLNNVDHFWFKNVSIKKIATNAFAKLSNIRYIYFRNVEINLISTNAFTNMRFIDYFFMRENITIHFAEDHILKNSKIEEIVFENCNVKATDFTLNGIEAKKIEIMNSKWHTVKTSKHPEFYQKVDRFEAKKCIFNRIVPSLFSNFTTVVFDSCQIHHLASFINYWIENLSNLYFKDCKIFQWHSHAIGRGSNITSISFESSQIEKIQTRAIYDAFIKLFTVDKTKFLHIPAKFIESAQISELIMTNVQVGYFSGEAYSNSYFGILLMNNVIMTKIEDKAFAGIDANQLQITDCVFSRFPNYFFQKSKIGDLAILSSQFRDSATTTTFKDLNAARFRFTHCEIICKLKDCEINSLYFQKSIHQLAWIFEHNRCVSLPDFQTVTFSRICINATEIFTNPGLYCKRRNEIEECICNSDEPVVLPKTHATMITIGDCNEISLVENYSPQLYFVYLYRIGYTFIQVLPKNVKTLNLLHSTVRFDNSAVMQNPSMDKIQMNNVNLEFVADLAFVEKNIKLISMDHSKVVLIGNKSFFDGIIDNVQIQSSEIINSGDLFMRVKHATIKNSKISRIQPIATIPNLCFENNLVECRCQEPAFQFDYNSCKTSTNQCINGFNFENWRKTRELPESTPCFASNNDQKIKNSASNFFSNHFICLFLGEIVLSFYNF